MATTPHLPQELIDRIIEEFCYEHPFMDEAARKALRACTLVSKSYSAAARRYLLSDVVIHDRESMNVFLRRRLRIYPDLPDQLRSLRIYLSDASISDVGDLLSSIIARPEKLERLAILSDRGSGGYSFGRLLKELKTATRPNSVGLFSTLSMLHLRNLNLHPPDIAEFKYLDTLILEECSFHRAYDYPGEGDGTFLDPTTFQSLEVLSITANLSGFWEGLTSCIRPSPQQKLAFSNLRTFRCVVEHEDLVFVQRFLLDYGAGMRLVKLDITQKIPEHFGRLRPMGSDRLDLSKLRKLRDLKLECIIPFKRKCLHRSTLFTFLWPLSPLTHSITVRNLHIALSLPLEDDSLESLGNVEDWESLDAVLSDRFTYPFLRSFSFSLCMRATEERQDDARAMSESMLAEHAPAFAALQRSRLVAPRFDSSLVIVKNRPPPPTTSARPAVISSGGHYSSYPPIPDPPVQEDLFRGFFPAAYVPQALAYAQFDF